jgi:PD-(D/E)XK endonuclease
MKKRQPKITDKKRRGEWAEMIFMARAAERGIAISKPWGDTTSYDFVAGRPGHFVAVQVKCTLFEIAEGLEKGYLCTVCSSGRPYRRGSFDFLAAYVIYEDAWYIIPEEDILGKKSISLATNCEEARYESFREAWHLLEECSEDENKGIDIQACAEEFSFESIE